MSGWIDRNRLLVLAVLTAAFLATTVVKARAKPFWHDEIYTIMVAGLPAMSDVWGAFGNGLDLSPPLTALATRLTRTFAGEGPVATRLPSIAAFWIACAVIFVIVRRRSNAALALAAAILPYHTAAYRFAIEARGYSLALACSAIALFAWLEAARPQRRRAHLVVMAIALAGGVWAHYFAVLTGLPILVGEIVRTWRSRRVDWGVVGAIAGAAAATLPLAPLATAGVRESEGFWTRQAAAGVTETYDFLFAPMFDWMLVPAAAIVVVAAIAGLARKFRRRPEGQRAASEERPAGRVPAHEVAAGIVAVVLPACAVLLGSTLGIGMVPRYALFSIAGIAAAVSIAIWSVIDRRPLVSALLCVTFIVSFGWSVADSLRPGRHPFLHPVQSRALFMRSVNEHDPLVVSSGLWFLQLWFYSTPEQRARLLYVADPPLARELTGSDTLDRGYIALSRVTDIRVTGYGAFTATSRDAYVYSLGAHWLVDKLRRDRATVDEEAREPGAVLYHVRIPPH
ncbi:MAG TPA: glycosyltransferase family 39 protein [Vicinamibacterales bacterium]|nr:glycosyltransferase family 39 protein [Vicinamibacterales bacterium]